MPTHLLWQSVYRPPKYLEPSTAHYLQHFADETFWAMSWQRKRGQNQSVAGSPLGISTHWPALWVEHCLGGNLTSRLTPFRSPWKILPGLQLCKYCNPCAIPSTCHTYWRCSVQQKSTRNYQRTRINGWILNIVMSVSLFHPCRHDRYCVIKVGGYP